MGDICAYGHPAHQQGAHGPRPRRPATRLPGWSCTRPSAGGTFNPAPLPMHPTAVGTVSCDIGVRLTLPGDIACIERPRLPVYRPQRPPPAASHPCPLRIVRAPFHTVPLPSIPPHTLAPSLTHVYTTQSYYEAKYGKEAWEALDKIPRGEWMDYLVWYRRVLGIPVQNSTKVEVIRPLPEVRTVREELKQGDRRGCRRLDGESGIGKG